MAAILVAFLILGARSDWRARRRGVRSRNAADMSADIPGLGNDGRPPSIDEDFGQSGGGRFYRDRGRLSRSRWGIAQHQDGSDWPGSNEEYPSGASDL